MRTMYILRTDDRPTDLAFWKISNGYISATGHPIDFLLILGMVFGDGGSNGLTSGCTKSKIRPPAILQNFE